MKNVIVEAKCIDMTIEGYGVCKVDNLVIFTKGMIKDEVAKIKIISHKKNLAYAIIDEMIKESPYRVVSDCDVAHKCGGCDLRHISYDYQLELKKSWVKQTMKSVANLDVEVKDVVASPIKDRYRNKVQVPVAMSKMGFYRNNSHDIVEYDDCKIQSVLSNRILEYLKNIIIPSGYDKYFRHILIKHAFSTNEVMVAFITNVKEFNGLNELVASLVSKFSEIKSVILNINTRNDNVILGNEEYTLYGSNYIVDELDGIKFNISLKSFYQINSKQTVNLYNEVVKRANIDKNTKVLDLYSGIGSISLFVARFAKEVVGVEIVKEAVENAKENAIINRFDNVKFYLDDAANHLDMHLKGQDVVIVDPPRKGLNKSVILDIANASINKVVYVSCNPATLARDISIFKDNGYEPDYIRPFDMFPNSTHVECVCLLTKNK